VCFGWFEFEREGKERKERARERERKETKISLINQHVISQRLTGRGLREEQGAGGEALEFFAVCYQ